MAPLVYVMAILGCGDDGAACTRERVAPVSYVSAAECRAAIPTILAQHTDLSYPVISAACQRGGDAIAQEPPRRQRRAG